MSLRRHIETPPSPHRSCYRRAASQHTQNNSARTRSPSARDHNNLTHARGALLAYALFATSHLIIRLAQPTSHRTPAADTELARLRGSMILPHRQAPHGINSSHSRLWGPRRPSRGSRRAPSPGDAPTASSSNDPPDPPARRDPVQPAINAVALRWCPATFRNSCDSSVRTAALSQTLSRQPRRRPNRPLTAVPAADSARSQRTSIMACPLPAHAQSHRQQAREPA